MSETLDWGTEANAEPKPKKRVPTWAWFCGGGCLLALIVAGVAAVVAINIGRKAMDQDAQWEALAQVLPYDSKPEGAVIFGMSWAPGIEHGWQIQRGQDLIVQVLVLGGSTAEQLREQLETPEDAMKLKELAGLLGSSDGSSGKLVIQGREVTFARFTPKGETEDSEPQDESGSSRKVMEQIGRSLNPPTVVLDLSTAGSDDFVLLTYKRLAGSGPVTDEELLGFLAPFHIGPDR